MQELVSYLTRHIPDSMVDYESSKVKAARGPILTATDDEDVGDSCADDGEELEFAMSELS